MSADIVKGTSSGTGTAKSRAVLVWFAMDGVELWAVPTDADMEALETVDGRSVYTGDDCPPDVSAAAMRSMVARGHLATKVWERFHLALEDGGATEAGIDLDAATLDAVEAWPGDHRITAMAAIPAEVDRVFAVYDDIQW